MKKFLDKLYSEKTIKLLLIIFPFVELATSISIIKFNFSITPGKIYKLFLLFYTVFYMIFIDKNSRKLSYPIIGALGICAICNIIFTVESFSIANIYIKALELCGFVAFPIYTLFFITYVKNGNKISVKTLITVAAIYSLVIFIADITGTAFASRYNSDYGKKGWFFSANEIGQLLTILYPIVVYSLITTPSISRGVSVFLSTYALLNIGTKAALFGVVGTVVCFIAYGIFSYITKKQNVKNTISVCLVLLIVMAPLLPFTPTYKYLKAQYVGSSSSDQMDATEDLIFTGRQYKLNKQLANYNSSSLINKLFGIEESLKEVGEGEKYFIVERDFHDTLFNYGIVGLAIYIAVLLIVLVPFGIYILKDIKKNCKLYSYTLILSSGLVLVAAYISGHTLSSLAVSLFVGVILSKVYAANHKIQENSSEQTVMFICSIGGHLTQMLQIKKIFNNYDYVLITEKTNVTKNIKAKYNMKYLIHGTRKYMFKYLFIELYNVLKSIIYFFYYSPEVVVTTGTHTAVPMCFIAKFFGRKVVFIESFAKRTTPTKSGKLVYKIADTFVVQWDSLKEVYPKAEVWGWIY